MTARTTTRAPWLEPHDRFEGVGAHELNWRYDHVDGGGWDAALRELTAPTLATTPALFRAQSLLAVVPIRFDGADLSHHNDDAGPIDWPMLRSAGSWIATKATQSTGYVDPTFAEHRRQMALQAFTHRGLYHWLSSTTDPVAQALHFLAVVGSLVPGEFAMLDAEEAGITEAMVLAWCEVVEAFTGRPCTIYSGAFVTAGTIWQSDQIRNGAHGRRPMHLAAYTTEARAKALPGVATHPWQAWQYTSNGPVPGVVGRCDMNRIDDVAAYDLAAGTQGDDMPAAIRLLIPTDDINGALYFAECFGGLDAAGLPSVALSARWTGPGGPKVDAAIAAHRAAGMTDYRVKVADFINIALDGPLPPGWTPAMFRNTDEIIARSGTVDQTARDAAAHANAGIDMLDQRLDAASQALA